MARMMKDPAAASASCQVGVLALSRGGSYGAYALREGFTYALGSAKDNALQTSEYALKP